MGPGGEILRFELHSGDSATYVWSSHLARFAALTPVEKKSVPKFLASISNGVAVWETPAEFRAFATMVHEVAHYFQDLTTGIGTWDFLKRRDNLRTRLSYLRAAQEKQAIGETRLMRSLISMAQEKDRELNTECVFVPISEFPSERREKLQKGMSACIGKEAPEDDVVPFLVENMLESEAAMATFSTIRNLKVSDEQWEIAKDNNQLWSFASMPEVYTHTVSLLMAIFEHWMGGTMAELRQEYGPAAFEIFHQLMTFIIDLCWAYPDPDYFRDSGVQHHEFDPGLKLMRLLARLQRGNAEEAAAFQSAVLKEKDFDKAEAILLANCGFTYIPARKIYAAWSGYLEKLCQSDDDRLLKSRKHICDLRQKHTYEMAGKRLGHFVTAHIDLHYVANGIQSYWTSPAFLDDDYKFVMADLLRFNRDLAIADYLVGTTAFVCPWAEARICDAAKDSCRMGITMPEQFPEAHECSVRHALESARFNLRRLQ